MAALFVALSFLAPTVAKTGVPAVHSLLVQAPTDSLEIEVVEFGQMRRRRACDYTATVRWQGVADYERNICEIPPEIWRTLRPGDKLILTGLRTGYGQRYDTIGKRPGQSS